VAKNAEIQSAIDRVEAAERDKQDVDDATIALSEEEQAEVDENYEPVRSRSFTFEVPADKLKDGEGKVRFCCKTRYNCCVICDLIHHTSPIICCSYDTMGLRLYVVFLIRKCAPSKSH
jgi:hypothetical protein